MSDFIQNEIMSFEGILLEELPQGFSTKCSLDFRNSNIKKLPNDLHCNGYLNICQSPIKELPQGLQIGGNLYIPYGIDIPKDALIAGNIITENGELLYHSNNPNHIVTTDEGKKVIFSRTTSLISEKNIHNDFYLPEVIFFVGVDLSKNAFQYEEDNKKYTIFCTSRKDGIKKFHWNRANEKGLKKYLDYDIYKPRSVSELIEIFKVCTGSCNSGIEKFLKQFNIDNQKLYSINDVNIMLEQIPLFSVPAKEVFIETFKPKETE